MRNLIIAGLLVVSGASHAAVTAETTESQVTNVLFNACNAQRKGFTMVDAVTAINPNGPAEVTALVIKGYEFGRNYPNVGCNQFFTVVIDQLVKSRSKV